MPVGFQQRLVHPGRLSAPNARAGAGTHPADGRRCPVNAPRIAHPAAWPAVPSRPRHAMPCHLAVPTWESIRLKHRTWMPSAQRESHVSEADTTVWFYDREY